ncbi:MAG: hypothetical protein KFB95_08945 [Simkaniaceae bacterium]|nr:MAG: hypothetical protein KFB95_08945 [Simkaniaceae bacterium]
MKKTEGMLRRSDTTFDNISLVAHVKAAAKTFGEIADELRSFGCINAAFKDGHVTL